MSLDGQMERLCAVYEEKSDGELVQMYADRDDLTEVAQQALAQVMQGRRLSTQAAGVTAAESEEEADDKDDEVYAESLLADNEVCIYQFRDAFEASEALRLISEAGIETRVVNLDGSGPASAQYRPVYMGVVVHRANEKTARGILADKMGLFPEREADDPFAELEGLMQVGTFERADALVVAQTLGEAGFSFVWNDHRDDRNATSDDVSIDVKGARLKQAQKLVGTRLGVVEEDSA